MRGADVNLDVRGRMERFLIAVAIADALIRAVVFLTAEVVILLRAAVAFDDEA